MEKKKHFFPLGSSPLRGFFALAFLRVLFCFLKPLLLIDESSGELSVPTSSVLLRLKRTLRKYVENLTVKEEE